MAKAHQINLRDTRDLPVFLLDNALIDTHGAQIGAYGVAVYVMLARFAKQNHATILAYQTIADALGIGRTTVRNTLKDLAAKGLIRIDSQTDDAGIPIASNRYTLLPIGDKKEVDRLAGGATTRQGVPPHDTPLSPDDMGGATTRQGVPPHDTTLSPDDMGGATTRIHSKSTNGVGVGDHVGDDGDRALETYLSALPMFPATVQQIMTMHLDGPTVIAACQVLLANGWGIGAIADQIRKYPPKKGERYEQPERPAGNGRGSAANGAERLPGSNHRAQRARGSHNPSGGAELRDPGWKERLIAQAERGELP